MNFAKRMSHIEASGIRKMFELKLKMKNPIDLSLGQADFDVPESVKEKTIQAIVNGKNGYTVTAGIAPLREVINQALEKESIKPQSSMIIAGASGGLLLSLLALADESSEVLITDPCFVSYLQLIRLTGATPKWISTYPDFRLTPEKLEAAITPKTKILIFNSPVNPTGIAYSESELKSLAEVTKSHSIQVISDEVYDKFSYDFEHTSWLKCDPDALMIRAFSKTLGAAGWRIGFAAGPRDLIDQMSTIQQVTFVCANTPAQWGCLEAYHSKLPNFQSAYQKKRDLVISRLTKVFEFARPQGAFYLFPKYPGSNGPKFIQKCLEREVLVVPGKAFSRQDSHFRISFAASDEALERGLELLVEIAEEIKSAS